MKSSRCWTLCLLLLLYLGPFGLCQNPATCGGIPLVESVLQQGINYANVNTNSPSSQLMNSLLTVANAKGVLPEVVSTSRAIYSQNGQHLPATSEVISKPNVGAYNSLFPVTSTHTLSVLPTSYQAQPNTILIPQSYNILPPVQPCLEPQAPASNISPIPTHAPLTQSHSSVSYDEDSHDYYTLRYEDFFDYPYDIPNNCVCQNSDKTLTVSQSAHDVHTTIAYPDINSASTSVSSVPESIKQIPYNLEINLPLLTQIVPIADTELSNPPATPPQVPSAPAFPQYAYPPLPPPPIIIQGSGSKSKNKLSLLLICLLSNGGLFDNSGNNCNCGNGASIPIPYPIVVPTNNPIIIDESPKKKLKRKPKKNKKDEKKNESN